MGSESNSPSSSSSPSGKRSRDPEDEVYVDNLHSHKRYLSEIMASSLNGLTVGDPLHENLMESPPARSETMFYLRDDMSLQYSPMSEDSDDNRYCEAPINTSSLSPQTDSLPTSPVSPHRYQRPLSGALSSSTGTTACPSSHGCTLAAVTCAHPRQRGGSDSEGRFPSSPSDICHSADLRRAALLRSVQMRAQPLWCPPAFELPFGAAGALNMEAEERPCLVDERDYQIDDCSSMAISDHEFNREKSCRVLNLNLKGEESSGD